MVGNQEAAVFQLLNESRNPIGTCFAFDETHIITARNNLFPANNPILQHVITFIQILDIMIQCEVVVGGVNNTDDQDGWLILQRMDVGKFDTFIPIRVTNELNIKRFLPYFTMYHFPFHLFESSMLPPTIEHTSNRIADSQQGKLFGMKNFFIAGGSCGAPYVEDASGTAIGMHLYGGCATQKIATSLEMVMEEDRPRGLHFLEGSPVVIAWRSLLG